MIQFTEEERMVIDIYNDGSRLFTVAKMQAALPHVEDKAMESLMKSIINKLLKISDKDFKKLPESSIQ